MSIIFTTSPGQICEISLPSSSCKIKLGSGSSSISIVPVATTVELQITLFPLIATNSKSQHPGSSISEYGISKSDKPSLLRSEIQEGKKSLTETKSENPGGLTDQYDNKSVWQSKLFWDVHSPVCVVFINSTFSGACGLIHCWSSKLNSGAGGALASTNFTAPSPLIVYESQSSYLLYSDSSISYKLEPSILQDAPTNWW